MSIFDGLQNMNFREAYGELSTIVFEEGKETVQNVAKQITHTDQNEWTVEDVKGDISFG